MAKPCSELPGCPVDWAYKIVGPVDLRGWCLRQAQLQEANFSGADLRGVDFRGADVRGAVFDKADLSHADLTGALLQGSWFRGARLVKASLMQGLLVSAHLEGADIDGATFAGANLEWAWIQGTDFSRAVVSGALFLNVRGLSEANRLVIEHGGGFTGYRRMVLGRELYETALLPPPSESSVECDA